MNARQKAFFEYHVELAQTFCTKEENTFWIFDLEDDLAFSLATRFQTPEELRSHLELQRSNGKMSAYTMTTNEDALHKIRKIENRTPLDRTPPKGQTGP